MRYAQLLQLTLSKLFWVCDLQAAYSTHRKQAVLQGWYQLTLHKQEAHAMLLGGCLQAWAALAKMASLLRFLLIEHAALRQVGPKAMYCDILHVLCDEQIRVAD